MAARARRVTRRYWSRSAGGRRVERPRQPAQLARLLRQRVAGHARARGTAGCGSRSQNRYASASTAWSARVEQAGGQRARRGPPSCRWPARRGASCSSCAVHSTSDSEPAAELQVELRVLAGRDPLALDPGLQPADLPLVVGGEAGRPDVLVEHVHEAPPPRRGRRRPAGPGPSPGAPTPAPTARSRCGSRRRERASRPCLPSGRRSTSTAQSRVAGVAPCTKRRSSVADPQALLGRRRRAALEDEDDVEVAGVRQLGAAEAAQGDHGERHRGPTRLRAPPRAPPRRWC